METFSTSISEQKTKLSGFTLSCKADPVLTGHTLSVERRESCETGGLPLRKGKKPRKRLHLALGLWELL